MSLRRKCHRQCSPASHEISQASLTVRGLNSEISPVQSLQHPLRLLNCNSRHFRLLCRAQLEHLKYADLGPSRPSDHYGALVDVNTFSSISVDRALLVLFATFTARRQIAHIVVSADLLQRELRLSESRATSRPSVALAPIHCMPKFAELSVRTSSFGSIPASTNSWTDLTDCNPPGSVQDEVSNQPYRRTEGCFTSVSTRRLRSWGGFPAPAVTHLTLMPAYCPFQKTSWLQNSSAMTRSSRSSSASLPSAMKSSP